MTLVCAACPLLERVFETVEAFGSWVRGASFAAAEVLIWHSEWVRAAPPLLHLHCRLPGR